MYKAKLHRDAAKNFILHVLSEEIFKYNVVDGNLW